MATKESTRKPLHHLHVDLEKHYAKEEVNTKILRVLPKKDWESKVTSIEEAHNLFKLSTNILFGKLLIYELTLRQIEEENKEKEEKKKGLSLKTSQELTDEKSFDDLSEENEELATLTRGFKKFLKRNNLAKKGSLLKVTTKRARRWHAMNVRSLVILEVSVLSLSKRIKE